MVTHMIPAKHLRSNLDNLSGLDECSNNMPVDYDEFRQTVYCERCRHETCRCPKYVPSQSGSILWMDGDIGMMVVSLYDGDPPDHVGQCYSAFDTESGSELVYQLMEYMAGPPHECMFRVKKVGDRNTLAPPERRSRRRVPRLRHLHS